MTGHSTYFAGARRPAGVGTRPMSPVRGADPEQATYRDVPGGQHVLVTLDDAAGQQVPGLLTQWRKSPGQLWQGLVTYPDLYEGEWVTARGWLRSSLIQRLSTDGA